MHLTYVVVCIYSDHMHSESLKSFVLKYIRIDNVDHGLCKSYQ